MAKRKTLYRVVCGNGAWFAYHHHTRVEIWMRHARRTILPVDNGNWRSENAIFGRTPSEALYRLKQALHQVA